MNQVDNQQNILPQSFICETISSEMCARACVNLKTLLGLKTSIVDTVDVFYPQSIIFIDSFFFFLTADAWKQTANTFHKLLRLFNRSYRSFPRVSRAQCISGLNRVARMRNQNIAAIMALENNQLLDTRPHQYSIFTNSYKASYITNRKLILTSNFIDYHACLLCSLRL